MRQASDSPPRDRAPSTVLGARGVVMAFGGTTALDGVDLSLHAGEVHALLGENGAGKSTLIKVLAGVYPRQGGEVTLDGHPVEPHKARLPIAFIHQELGLVDSASIGENVALGTGFARRGALISWRRVHASAAELLARSGLDVDTTKPLSTLSAAERSIVAITRALALEARVIVLDEPTASLAEADVAQLFAALRRAAADGMAILYVTHRLDEVFRLADRVTVLRNGRVVASRSVAETDSDELVRDIIGFDPGELFSERPEVTGTGEDALCFEGAVSGRLGPFSLRLARGEVLGVTGRRGAGHEIVGRLAVGDLQLTRGRLVLHGAAVTSLRPRKAARLGVALVPAKRADEALATGLSVRENLFPNLTSVGQSPTRWRRASAERARAAAAAARLNVRMSSLDAPVETLSGGNQQKVILLRCLATDPQTLVLEEPTTGVDVGTKAEIYRKIAELASSGVSVLMISSDFEEVAGVCDRAIVFDRGRVAGELCAPELDLSSLINLAVARAHAA